MHNCPIWIPTEKGRKGVRQNLADLGAHVRRPLRCSGSGAGAVPSARTVSSSGVAGQVAVIENGAPKSRTLRFDTRGKVIDAHDGEIKQFGGTFYLYGTSYGCGYYRFSKRPTPFCGFKVYTSVDLVRWVDRGYLFNPRSGAWQARCNSLTLSCYRPHVLFNQRTGKYVLWVTPWYVPNGYHVLTSNSPTGPFREIKLPVLATARGGDLDLFQDEDGVAYIATTLRPGYRLGIERAQSRLHLRDGARDRTALQEGGGPFALQAGLPLLPHLLRPWLRLLCGDGHLVRDRERDPRQVVGPNQAAPAVMRWPADRCRRADDRWEAAVPLSERSVEPTQSERGTGGPALGAAQVRWVRADSHPDLRGTPGGARLRTGPAPGAGDPQVAAWSAPATWTCNLKAGKSVSQTFKVTGAGRLTVRTVLFRQRMYGKSLRVAVKRTKAGRPVGKAIWRASVPAGRLSWPRRQHPSAWT